MEEILCILGGGTKPKENGGLRPSPLEGIAGDRLIMGLGRLVQAGEAEDSGKLDSRGLNQEP